MKFRNFGKTVLTAALSSAIVFSLSSCTQSFTSGYLYVTGTVTATPSGNGIISGFKIDNNTGKLTAMHGLPIGSGGANPVRVVLLTGGRFVYVLNRGANSSGGSVCTTADPCTGSTVTQFVVGGNGILTPQGSFPTQGINPFRLLQDSSGNHLIVLDHDAPSRDASVVCNAAGFGTACADITVFSIDSNTGRLSLVTNAQLTASTGNQVSYFPVPVNPIDFTFASGYIMTLSGLPNAPAGQTVYPYGFNSGSGQLTISQSTPQIINNGGGNPLGQGTAIVFATSKIYILDNEPLVAGGTPGQILPFTIGTNGALQSQVGGAVADDPTQTSPIYLIAESKGKYIYVANQQGASSTTGSGLAGYVLDPASSQLSLLAGEPFSSGANPQCLLEDPSSQFIYTANANDSTVTGHVVDPNSGVLNPLHNSTSTFPLKGPATWCVATGRTN